MKAANETEVPFMDVVNHPMCFISMFSYLDIKEKVTLRLVSKELRDAVNLNVRSIAAELADDDSQSILDSCLLVSKLPNLQIIKATAPLSSSGIINIWKAAQLASSLTKLELRISVGDLRGGLPFSTIEERAELLDNSIGTINHHHWPLLQSLCLSGLDTSLTVQPMKGLLRLSTLTQLDLSQCTFNNESINPIQPGSRPCVRRLQCDRCSLEDPAVAVRALLHLTGLERLSLDRAGITGRALAQIQPGSWPNMQVLDLEENTLRDDPVGAMKGLLCLTALIDIYISANFGISGEAISQIKPGDWPHLDELDLFGSNLSDDPVGAMNGLLRLTSLQHLDVGGYSLTGEAVTQIMPGDWPHLQTLKIFNNNFSDDPVGAMNGLLRLTSLQHLRVAYCRLTGEAVTQIKPGDWPHLQKLWMLGNAFRDNKEGARMGLLHLTSLDMLFIWGCGWTEEETREIHRALRIE